MKKKIIIGVIAVVVVLGAAMAYLNYRNYSLSPRGSASFTNGELSVSITYCRPSVRGRVIFGTKEEGALQPYGAYWRLGANESTEVTFNKDVSFNGSPLKAGTYRLYAVPGEKEFEIIVNTELGKWGAFEPNHEADVLSTKVPVQASASPVEQHTITVVQAEGGIDINVEWEKVKFVVPVR